MTPPPIRFLSGERVYLRPLEEADLPLCQLWINDPEIRRYLLVAFPFDAKAERAWWEGQDRSRIPGSLSLAIVLQQADKLIGTTGFHRIDWLNRRAESGSLIGDKSCWGQGYGTEAKALLVEYAFDTLGLHRIDSQTFCYNERSARHLRRAGFVEEGRLRQAIFREGKFHDVLLFGLLAADWRAAT